MMKEWVRKLLDASKVLCQEYSDIMKAHSGEMEAAHTDVLCDTNKYSTALHMAMGEWQVDIERALQILGTSPGISAFNTQAKIVQVKTNQFWEKVDAAEVAFLTSKRKTEVGRATLLEWMKAELDAKVNATIERFITDKLTVVLDVVGPTGGHDAIRHANLSGVCRLWDPTPQESCWSVWNSECISRQRQPTSN